LTLGETTRNWKLDARNPVAIMSLHLSNDLMSHTIEGLVDTLRVGSGPLDVGRVAHLVAIDLSRGDGGESGERNVDGSEELHDEDLSIVGFW